MTSTQEEPNYWRRRCAAEAQPTPTQKNPARSFDREDIWFSIGLFLILSAAQLWAWSPTMMYGTIAIPTSIFWSLIWGFLVCLAWWDTHRR